MDLETTGPEMGHSSESQIVDYEENEEESKAESKAVLSDSNVNVISIEGAYGDPLADPLSCGRNNNRLPDGYLQDVSGGAIDTETNYDGSEVKIMSSLPPKNSRIGQKSKCAKCDEIVSSSYMSRHIKRYHCIVPAERTG